MNISGKGSGWFMVLCLAANILSGAILWLFYEPTTCGAYDSIVVLQTSSTVGAFARSLHYHSSHFFIAGLVVHLIALLFGGRSIAAKEWRKWASGTFAAALLLGVSFTGRVLPWDQHAGVSLIVANNLSAIGPFRPVSFFFGHSGPLLGRILLVHVVAAMVGTAIVAFHVSSPTRQKGECEYGWGTPLLVIFGAAALVAVASLLESPLGFPFDESLRSTGAAAQWYLKWVQFIAERSIIGAVLSLVGLFAFTLLTPTIARAVGDGIVKIGWSAILVALTIISFLRVGVGQ